MKQAGRQQQEQEVEETKKTLDVMRRNAERTEKQLEDMGKQMEELRAIIGKENKQVDERLQTQDREDQILAEVERMLAEVERLRGGGGSSGQKKQAAVTTGSTLTRILGRVNPTKNFFNYCLENKLMSHIYNHARHVCVCNQSSVCDRQRRKEAL